MDSTGWTTSSWIVSADVNERLDIGEPLFRVLTLLLVEQVPCPTRGTFGPARAHPKWQVSHGILNNKSSFLNSNEISRSQEKIS